MATAKFGGKCKCGARVEAGAAVAFADRKIAACAACDPKLAAKTAAPVTELRVRIVGIRFAKPDGWGVAQVVFDAGAVVPADCPFAPGRPFSVSGPLGGPKIGDILEIRGRAVQDERWGWQFDAQVALPAIAATDQALVRFLQSFEGIGPARAQKILRALGGRTAVLDALENHPDRLMVVEGVTADRARAMAEKYQEKSGLRDTLFFLAGLGISDESALHRDILATFGPDAKVVIAEDPYRLMQLEGVGFRTADEHARKLGVPITDPRRTAALVLSLIQKAEGDGHAWSSPEDLLALANPRRA